MMITMFAAALLQAALPTQTAVKAGTAQAAPATAIARKSDAPRRLHRVVIDAGHGGVDPGASMRSSSRIHEKDITLQVSLKLGELLSERGVEVRYTRTRDTLIALDDRGRIANEAGGDVFISIHVNAADPNWPEPSSARGFETYFLAAARTEDARRVEALENESVRFESDQPGAEDDPLGFILSHMMQNEHLRQSSDLAEIVQKHLGKVHPGPSRGVKQAGFRVLVNSFMPAVLVELGFGTNKAEAAFLSSQTRQRALARAVADATMEYLERYDRRVGGGSASSVHE